MDKRNTEQLEIITATKEHAEIVGNFIYNIQFETDEHIATTKEHFIKGATKLLDNPSFKYFLVRKKGESTFLSGSGKSICLCPVYGTRALSQGTYVSPEGRRLSLSTFLFQKEIVNQNFAVEGMVKSTNMASIGMVRKNGMQIFSVGRYLMYFNFVQPPMTIEEAQEQAKEFHGYVTENFEENLVFDCKSFNKSLADDLEVKWNFQDGFKDILQNLDFSKFWNALDPREKLSRENIKIFFENLEKIKELDQFKNQCLGFIVNKKTNQILGIAQVCNYLHIAIGERMGILSGLFIEDGTIGPTLYYVATRAIHFDVAMLYGLINLRLDIPLQQDQRARYEEITEAIGAMDIGYDNVAQKL